VKIIFNKTHANKQAQKLSSDVFKDAINSFYGIKQTNI